MRYTVGYAFVSKEHLTYSNARIDLHRVVALALSLTENIHFVYRGHTGIYCILYLGHFNTQRKWKLINETDHLAYDV